MARITEEMVRCAYETAKRVWNGSISQTDGRDEIVRLSGMSSGYAGVHIAAFKAMIEGKKYSYCINCSATEYYLTQIGLDYGSEAQKRAALSVKAHVTYYHGVSGVYLAKIARLADRFLT